MFFIGTENWALAITPKLKIVKIRKSGIETAILHGNAEKQVAELKTRLRYLMHIHGVPEDKPKKKPRKKKPVDTAS